MEIFLNATVRNASGVYEGGMVHDLPDETAIPLLIAGTATIAGNVEAPVIGVEVDEAGPVETPQDEVVSEEAEP